MTKRANQQHTDAFGIVDDPVFQEAINTCLDKIQALGLWRIFQQTQLPDGAVGLELGGARRLVVRDGKFSIEYRDWDSGDWLDSAHCAKSAVWGEMTLRGGAQQPYTMGRNLLRGVAKWAAARTMEQLKHKLPDPKQIRDEEQKQLEIFRQEAMEGLLVAKIRSHLLGSTKSRHVSINWLAYTKAVWTHVDRDALRLMLLRKFRESFSVFDYISMQDQAPKLARLASVSQSLAPWLSMIDTPHFERAMALIEQGEPLPKSMTAYQGDIRAFSPGSPWQPGGLDPDVTIMVREVDWRILARQPFSFVHAMCQMERQHHAPFLDAWMALPANVRKKASWIIQSAPHGYNRNDDSQGPPWSLIHHDHSLWPGLIRIMVEQAVREQQQKGYAIVVSRKWRQAFFDDLAGVGEWWRKHPDRRPTNSPIEVAQLLACLPPGRFHAGYSEAMLEAGTAQARACPTKAKARL